MPLAIELVRKSDQTLRMGPRRQVFHIPLSAVLLFWKAYNVKLILQCFLLFLNRS